MFYPGHKYKSKKPFLSYQELRVFIRERGIIGLSAYDKFWLSLAAEERETFPANPNLQYPEYSYEEFFGYSLFGKLPIFGYDRLKSFVEAAGIKSLAQYRKYRGGLKLEESRFWPRDPGKAYPKRYSHQDFFGPEESEWAGRYSFPVLKRKVQDLKIGNIREYLSHRESLVETERARWPYNPWNVYKEMRSKSFFYSDDRSPARRYLKLKEEMAKLGIDTFIKYQKYRASLPPDERKFWPAHPQSTFKPFYIPGFYGSWGSRVKKRSYEFLKERCREFEWKSQADYRQYKKRLSLEERRRWPEIPWEYYGKTREDFFGFRKNQKNFYGLTELQRLMLEAKALYKKDYNELRRKDSRIPARPSDCRWFKGWDAIFPYRRDPEIIRCENRFFYSLPVLQLRLKTGLIFSKKNYLLWRAGLLEKEKRLCPSCPRSIYEGWSWDCLAISVFESAAEVSRALKVLGVRDREGYRRAELKYPCLPESPEDFFDWPGKLERFTEDEAWEIFLGVYNEDHMNSDVHEPFIERRLARREIAAADKRIDDLGLNAAADFSFKDDLELQKA